MSSCGQVKDHNQKDSSTHVLLTKPARQPAFKVLLISGENGSEKRGFRTVVGKELTPQTHALKSFSIHY